MFLNRRSTVARLATDMFQREAGIQLTHMPDKGVSLGLTDVAGRIGDMRGRIQALRLRIDGVTGDACIKMGVDVGAVHKVLDVLAQPVAA